MLYLSLYKGSLQRNFSEMWSSSLNTALQVLPDLTPTLPHHVAALGFCSHDTENSLFIKCVQNKMQRAKFDSFKLITISLSSYLSYFNNLFQNHMQRIEMMSPSKSVFQNLCFVFPLKFKITITTLQIYSVFLQKALVAKQKCFSSDPGNGAL